MDLQLCNECIPQNHLFCPTHNQDQNSVTFLFQPFKFLLNDLIEQNKQLKQDMNQLRQQNETHQQSFVQQLAKQSTKIERLHNEINQLKTTSSVHTNDINKIQANYQNQNSHSSDINQRHDLLKTKFESIEKYIGYPRKFRTKLE
jgi:septal ring factor EnvC (AmiA/AmiB activator)